MNYLMRTLKPMMTGSSRQSSRLFSAGVMRMGTFEPDYLDSSGPVIPTYPPINIQIKGMYDTLWAINAAWVIQDNNDYCTACSCTVNVLTLDLMMFLGYNFDILESTQSYIHNLAENMGINVENSWATPSKTYQITTFK